MANTAGVTIGQRTLGQVVVELARERNLILAEGEATAGSATTLTDATNMRLDTAYANDIVGKFLYFYGGTSAGTIREVTSYGTIGVFTWTGNATVPDATTDWVLLNRHPQYLIDAVLWAQRVLGFDTAVPYHSTGLVTDNLLDFYGDFDEWTGGGAAAPDGWTLSGAGAAVARSTGTTWHGDYSARLTPAAADAVLTWDPDDLFASQEILRRAAGRSLTLLGGLNNTVVGEGVVRVVTKKVGSAAVNTNRTGTATAEWESLKDISSATISVPDPCGNLQVQIRAAANGSLIYADDIILHGPRLYSQRLPLSLVALPHTIYMETATGNGDYREPLRYREHWMLRPKSSTLPREIQWFPEAPIESARHLLIQGLKVPSAVTATATALNIDGDLVATLAAGHLADATPTQKAEAREAAGRASTQMNGSAYIWLEDSLATT